MNTPTILVTNDDGVESPGLHAVIEAVAGLGRVVVAAPTTQQTSRGRAISGDGEACFKKIALLENHPEIEGYHMDASPAMVVQHALNVIFKDTLPDIVVSGINYGENLGTDIFISGTIGAAMQAATWGIPAIAASLQSDISFHYSYGEMHWDAAAHFVRRYTEILLETGPIEGMQILKIDVPENATVDTPERITFQSRHRYFDIFVPHPAAGSQLKEYKTVRWATPEKVEPGSDIHAVLAENAVSITPLVMDCSGDTGVLKKRLGGKLNP
jgi:5'-nucleotidase